MPCQPCKNIEYQKYIQNIQDRLKKPKFDFNFSCYRQSHKEFIQETVCRNVIDISKVFKSISNHLLIWTETPNKESVLLTEQQVLKNIPKLLIDFCERRLSFLDMDGSVKHQVGEIVSGSLEQYSKIFEHIPQKIHYVQYVENILYYLTSWSCESEPQWIPSLVLRNEYPQLLAEYLKDTIVWV